MLLLNRRIFWFRGGLVIFLEKKNYYENYLNIDQDLNPKLVGFEIFTKLYIVRFLIFQEFLQKVD